MKKSMGYEVGTIIAKIPITYYYIYIYINYFSNIYIPIQ
jgi:hypothetical protein